MFNGIGNFFTGYASSVGTKSWEALKGCIVNSLEGNKMVFISCEGMNINFKSKFIGARIVKGMISALDTYNSVAKEFIKTPLGPLYKRQIISNKKISDLLKKYQLEFKNFKQTSFSFSRFSTRLRKTVLRMSSLLENINSSCDKYSKLYTDEPHTNEVKTNDKVNIPKYRWCHLMQSISQCASSSISKIDDIIIDGEYIDFNLLELGDSSTKDKLGTSGKRRTLLNKNLGKGWNKIVLKSVESILKNLKEAYDVMEKINSYYIQLKTVSAMSGSADSFKENYVTESQKLIGPQPKVKTISQVANGTDRSAELSRPEYKKLFKQYQQKLFKPLSGFIGGEWPSDYKTNNFLKMLEDLCTFAKSGQANIDKSKEALKYELQSYRLLSEIKRLEEKAYDEFCRIRKTVK